MVQSTKFAMHITKSGRWRIAGTSGKALAIIEMTDSDGKTITHCPTEDNTKDHITTWLKAEMENDFADIEGDEYGHRPPQFPKKLQDIRDLLDRLEAEYAQ